MTVHHAGAVALFAGGHVLVEGVPMPSVIELSFLRRDLDSFPCRSNDPIPGPLDRPNHPGRADIVMNPF